MLAREVQGNIRANTWEDEDEEKLKEGLIREIDACVEVLSSYRNKVKKFMIEQEIWHISEINYEVRTAYGQFLEHEVKEVSFRVYMKGLDRIKQHSVQEQAKTLAGKNAMMRALTSQQLFLLYHPDRDIAMRFDNTINKELLLWDFNLPAPERIKQQVLHVLHKIIQTVMRNKLCTLYLQTLNRIYKFLIREGITDIENMEAEQVENLFKLQNNEKDRTLCKRVLNLSWQIIFVDAKEVNWNANIWYMERFHFEKSRVNPAHAVKRLSFMEVANRENRGLLKLYTKYMLILTKLAISVINTELIDVRRFLHWVDNETDSNIITQSAELTKKYFSLLNEKDIQAFTYNKDIMAIYHFYEYIKTRGIIHSIPFNKAYYLKKIVRKHYNRSVSKMTYNEVIENLFNFPEELRLMFLHFWSIGLRDSEVCTLNGDAYFTYENDTWIQVYQIKTKTYKRLPIPTALYEIMKIYTDKNRIQADEYIFRNRKGGAYNYGTLRLRISKCFGENQIKNEYMFQSHGYRHTIATIFYDNGVSIQSIRDYLGHDFEEMTMQYIDYMPEKISRANEEFWQKGENNLAANLKRYRDEKNN